jgi:uncharacterized protein
VAQDGIPGINEVNRVSTIGVLADTHIPDRARQLDARVLEIFRSAGVRAILHAGDVSVPRVLSMLAEIAPVYAVKGNRDWIWLGRLPAKLRLELEGITIGMAHGHGSLKNYLVDRITLLSYDYHHEMLIPRLLAAFPDTRVIVFGHGHLPLNNWRNGQLLFNPGSPHFPHYKHITPSIGLLHLSAGGEVRGEIINLA